MTSENIRAFCLLDLSNIAITNTSTMVARWLLFNFSITDWTLRRSFHKSRSRTRRLSKLQRSRWQEDTWNICINHSSLFQRTLERYYVCFKFMMYSRLWGYAARIKLQLSEVWWGMKISLWSPPKVLQSANKMIDREMSLTKSNPSEMEDVGYDFGYVSFCSFKTSIWQVSKTTLYIHALLDYDSAMELLDSDHVPSTQDNIRWELLSDLVIKFQQSLSSTCFLASLPEETVQIRKLVASNLDRYLLGEKFSSD